MCIVICGNQSYYLFNVGWFQFHSFFFLNLFRIHTCSNFRAYDINVYMENIDDAHFLTYFILREIEFNQFEFIEMIETMCVCMEYVSVPVQKTRRTIVSGTIQTSKKNDIIFTL